MKYRAILIIISIVFLSCKTKQEIHSVEKAETKIIVNEIVIEKNSIEKYAVRICDSIKLISAKIKEPELFLEQAEIYSSLIGKFLLDNDNSLNATELDFSVLNYRLTRELNKSCPNFKLKEYTLPLAWTNLLDIEGLFSESEKDSIIHHIREFERKKEVRLLIVSLDETYPHSNLLEYAEKQGNDWQIGSKRDKGGIMFVFSKSLRNLQISTTNESMKYLTNSEIQNTIDEILLKRFKNGEFYLGIMEAINDFEKKI